MREMFLLVLTILTVICYFGIGNSLDKKSSAGKGILSLLGMTLILGISLTINYILIDQNNELEKKTKNKCPEYKEIKAYVLK